MAGIKSGPTEVEQLLQAGITISAQTAKPVMLNGESFLVHPSGSGFEVKNLTQLLPPHAKDKPQRKLGLVVVHSQESFCQYVNAHKEAGATIFVNVTETGAKFTAVLNYHDSAANHGDHRVVFNLKPSVEWLRWMEKDRKPLGQVVFCEHLADCQDFITSPPGADLITLLQNIEGKVDSAFKQSINLHNGSSKLTFDEEVTFGASKETTKRPGEMEIPTVLELLLPPFANGPAWKAKARLKTRVEQRKVHFVYETLDTHLVVQAAVTDLIKNVAAATTITPLLGEI